MAYASIVIMHPCARLGHVCHVDPRFQFKAVHHVYQKSQGTPARFDLVWNEDPVWVDISQPGTPPIRSSSINLILLPVSFV